ncbi:MAG: YbjN domain-containing protein [Coriobacteriia bacterium]|nr:YbjN domain-containing protein [Coriobacteriia bacterium]
MTDSERVKELRELIARYLDELGLKYLRDSDNDFLVPFGEGVRVHLVPREFGDDMTVVQIIAPTNLDLDITPDLAMFLVQESSQFVFGRLAVHPDSRAVGFEETLLGSFLNRAELHIAIGVAAAMADKYDDEIQQRFGGRKAGRGF